MTVSVLGSMPASKLQALSVTDVVENAAASKSSDQAASSIVKAASGVRVSGRTAQSLTDILQASKVNLGYSKEETKSFTKMIDGVRAYLDTLKKQADAVDAAATVDPAGKDPELVALDAQAAATQKAQGYDRDFIKKMESYLDQVVSAFFDHKLVFQTFSNDGTGNVNIMAKSFKTTADGKTQTDLSFSFLQSRVKDPNTSQLIQPPQYGTMWNVNDLSLFNVNNEDHRVL